MRARRGRDFPIRRTLVVMMGLAICASAAWAQENGICVTADVPEAFTLPDGSEHPAGRLTLCPVEALSPVTELHSVSVDGRGLRFAMSRRALAESYSGPRSEILFRRSADGGLVLVGYVVPFGTRSRSYAMTDWGRGGSSKKEPSVAAKDLSKTYGQTGAVRGPVPLTTP